MTTRYIGIKEFRRDISKIAAASGRGSQRLILMRNKEPIFEIRPLSKTDASLERLAKQLKKSEKEIGRGKFSTQEQMERAVGLR